MELRQQEYYTYEDYQSWDEDVRCELIDGVIYNMASPSAVHQRILINLGAELSFFLRGKKCRLYPGPFGVRLKGYTKRDTVLEPDISVVCDSSKIDMNLVFMDID